MITAATRSGVPRARRGQLDGGRTPARVRRPARRRGRPPRRARAGRRPAPFVADPARAADRRGRDRAGRPRPPSATTPTRGCGCGPPPRRAGAGTAGSRPWSAASRSSAPPATVAVAAQSALPGDGALPGQARPRERPRRAHLRPRRPRPGPARQRRHPPRRGAASSAASTPTRPGSAEALDAFTAAGDRRLRPAGRRLPGDRRPVVDRPRCATFTADQPGPAERAAVRRCPPQSLDPLLQAAQALDQVQQTSRPRLPDLPGPGDQRRCPSVLAQATAGDGRLLAGRRPPKPHHGPLQPGSDGGPAAAARSTVSCRRRASPTPTAPTDRRRAGHADRATTCSTPSSTSPTG